MPCAAPVTSAIFPSRRPISVSSGSVAATDLLDVGERLVQGDDVGIAAADVAQIVVVRPLLDVADAILGHGDPKTVGERVDHRGADAAAGVAAGHDHGVDPL